MINNRSHVNSINITILDTNQLSNSIVKQAIDAFQTGDKTVWLSLFSSDVQLFDDGNPREFRRFSEETLGHDHFVSIDKVENEGLHVYGQIHSDRWGDFKGYFKFSIDPTGKITHLDIGQPTYYELL